jgi:tRNA modification GTPase
MDKRSDTIAAISTPHGRGGIGIIRISGPSTLDLVASVTKSSVDILSLSSFKTRKLIHAFVVDQGQTLDEILLAYMPANKAFTGETTIELNCHGGRAVLSAVLECVLKCGARLAEAGEFTRRAFENNRLNLVQAEAINDLIHARTKKAIKAAWRQMEGGLTSRCTELRENLFNQISELQAEIDFEIDGSRARWVEQMKKAEVQIQSMLKSAEKSKFLTLGCWAVISGPPNAGKSSIFNDIINIERSIVCDSPGTTRDHISEVLEIDGIEIRLTDTAGIRATDDKIESISIERSRQQVTAADIVIYVLDQSCEMKAVEAEEAERVLKDDGLVVLNKCDLAMHPSVKTFVDKHSGKNIAIISILSNYGVDDFLDMLAECINEKTNSGEDPIITNIRQTRLLESAKGNMQSAIEAIGSEGRLDICMYELELAMRSMSEIIGEISSEDILDNIFSKFCIGK